MRTIEWDGKKEAVKLIDQTLLPAEYKILECKTLEQLIDAIKRLKVRGAPALGVAGAFGVVLACIRGNSKKDVEDEVDKLRNARPTAVNLSYGVDRALNAALLGTTTQEM
ncbi:MAG: hypothetical protein KAT65_28225, partial [Methanophagales archaeon]|nr:hypothetical protein [Methanophagales archaeon]